MKHRVSNPFRPHLLLLVAGSSLLAISSVSAQATLTWDTAPGTIGAGDSAITGGTGNWNTTNGNWTTDAGVNNIAWNNSGQDNINVDNASFGGTAGTVTLDEAISLKNLAFTNTAGTYIVTGSTLNFTAGTITAPNPPNTSTVGARIESNITGAPAITATPMDGNEQFTLRPAASGSMSIGAITGSGGTGSEIINLEGGAGSTGTIASANGVKIIVYAGSWTLNGGSSGYQHAISGGTLTLNANLNGSSRDVTLSGGVLNYNVASAVSATAATASSPDRGFRITGGSLDQTSGAAINTNASTTSMTWANSWTFIGTNGAASNLHLGSGAVFLKSSPTTVSVTSAAATLIVGGVIQNDTTLGRGLTKSGAGTLELRGANSYTGATTVNAGTLKVGANNVIPDASNVTIGSATLDADTRTDTAGTLDVTGAAVINLGSGAALAFADSESVDWNGGTLNITGTLEATSLRFGDELNQPGLTPAQLALISVNGGGLGTYVLDANGYLVPGGEGNAYADWALANGVTGGPNGDHDFDGVKNLVEYALVDGGERGVLSGNTITFNKRGGVYGTDLTYIIETSETLASGSWSDAVTHTPAQLGSPISYTFTPSTPVKNFARLKVVTIP